MKGYVQDIEGIATRNENFRKVLYKEHFDGKTSE